MFTAFPSEERIPAVKMIPRLPFGQLMLAMLLGVGAGLYIYKPLIERHQFEQRQQNTKVQITDVEENK
ncbi:protein PIGBOS1 isoform X1 [Lithobates pipiens]